MLQNPTGSVLQYPPLLALDKDSIQQPYPPNLTPALRGMLETTAYTAGATNHSQFQPQGPLALCPGAWETFKSADKWIRAVSPNVTDMLPAKCKGAYKARHLTLSTRMCQAKLQTPARNVLTCPRPLGP